AGTSRTAATRSPHPRWSCGSSPGPRGPGRALRTLGLERVLEEALLDGEGRDDLLEVARLPLQLQLGGGLAAAAPHRLRAAAEAVLSPAPDRRRVHAEGAGNLVDGRLAGEQLEHGLLPLLDGAASGPGPHVRAGALGVRRVSGGGDRRRLVLVGLVH